MRLIRLLIIITLTTLVFSFYKYVKIHFSLSKNLHNVNNLKTVEADGFNSSTKKSNTLSKILSPFTIKKRIYSNNSDLSNYGDQYTYNNKEMKYIQSHLQH